MDHDVILLRNKADGETLNAGKDDDTKVAFQDEKAELFFTYTDVDVSALNPNDYSLGTISQSVVDGSGLITKTRRVFPKPW